MSSIRIYLDEEAGEEEQHAKNDDAKRACKHGILEGFHDLTCAAGEEAELVCCTSRDRNKRRSCLILRSTC